MSDLLHVSQISVLSEPDRQTIQEARRWARFLWQQGTSPSMDVIEHEGVFDLMRKLDDLYARTAAEPQLRGVRR